MSVAGLAELLDAIPAQSPPRRDTAARLTRKAAVLEELADASGDQALTHDARVLATQARRAARDLTPVSADAVGAENTTCTPTAGIGCDATTSGEQKCGSRR